MANMSYCRFENTAADLQDCADALEDELTSESEIAARAYLIRLCRTILDNAKDLGLIDD